MSHREHRERRGDRVKGENGECSALLTWLAGIALTLAAASPLSAQPITLHPENPHYFLFRGKPAFLLTSGEHYGAVLNRDFDFIPYLDELQVRGFNLTRLFSGTYREVPGSFQIRDNTLAPLPWSYLAPWARTETMGDVDFGPKFNLDTWDDAYFRRLHEFCDAAGKRGIVVEFVLFCPFYDADLWAANPMNARNNVNGIGTMPRTEVFTLKHPTMVARHEAFVNKVVTALREFDNLYFEICNEPYFGGVTLDWQARIASTIVAAERDLPAARRHLIAQNIANGSARIAEPNPAVSIFNFHYAIPPDTVTMNYALGRALGDDETGFKGVADRPYRTEGWLFLLAGGGLYNNLDYSFTTTHEEGGAPVRAPTPGGGGPSLRKQLAILREFLAQLDFVRMKPDLGFIKGGIPPKAQARALAQPGVAYAVYLSDGGRADLVLELPDGRYRVDWINPLTGAIDKGADLNHPGGRVTLTSPKYAEDVTLRVVRVPRSRNGNNTEPIRR